MNFATKQVCFLLELSNDVIFTDKRKVHQEKKNLNNGSKLKCRGAQKRKALLNGQHTNSFCNCTYVRHLQD